MIARIQSYLDQAGLHADVLAHQPSETARETAELALIPSHKLAKAVILKDHEGRHLMAIIPSDSKVQLSRLSHDLHRDFKLVSESELMSMYSEWQQGIAPIPMAFNMDAVVADELLQMDDLYLEAGDHRHVLHLGHEDFMKMMWQAKHGSFTLSMH